MKNKKGFTLAELLIVVAIIAVLVAVSIPIFAGQLEKAREAACMANGTTLQHHMIAELTTDPTLDLKNLLQLCIEKDTAKCPSGGTYSIYPSTDASLDTGFSIVCSKHGAIANLGDEQIRNDVIAALISENVDNIDSGAASIEGSYANDVVKNLNEKGYSLSEMNAVSWSWNKNDQFFFWTDEDIKTMNEGDKVPAIRYNNKTGTYTIWIMTITTGTTDKGNDNTEFNKFDGKATAYPPSTEQDKSLQTYDNAVKLLKEAQKSY